MSTSLTIATLAESCNQRPRFSSRRNLLGPAELKALGRLNRFSTPLQYIAMVEMRNTNPPDAPSAYLQSKPYKSQYSGATGYERIGNEITFEHHCFKRNLTECCARFDEFLAALNEFG